jgi:hypothetical protein
MTSREDKSIHPNLSASLVAGCILRITGRRTSTVALTVMLYRVRGISRESMSVLDVGNLAGNSVRLFDSGVTEL